MTFFFKPWLVWSQNFRGRYWPRSSWQQLVTRLGLRQRLLQLIIYDTNISGWWNRQTMELNNNSNSISNQPLLHHWKRCGLIAVIYIMSELWAQFWEDYNYLVVSTPLPNRGQHKKYLKPPPKQCICIYIYHIRGQNYWPHKLKYYVTCNTKYVP